MLPHCLTQIADVFENPTSPLGDRWFRTFVPILILSSNQLYLPTSFNFLPSSIQLYLPTSSNFPGGVVYPSSYLLPGLQNRPVALPRRRLYSTFSPSWSSSFFHHFSNTFFHRFWLHLGSQNGSQIHQKSTKNRSKNLIEKLTTFGVDFSSIFNGFWTQLHLKKHQKRCEGCQFLCFRYLYFKIDPNMFLTSFLHRFFLHFGSQIPPKMHPKTYQKNHQISHRFLFDFYRILASILAPIFHQNR